LSIEKRKKPREMLLLVQLNYSSSGIASWDRQQEFPPEVKWEEEELKKRQMQQN